MSRSARLFPFALVLLVALGLSGLNSGCSNNPYPSSEAESPVLYTSLAEDPKTLDPSIAYTIADGVVISNICDSYFQYHYLKRDPLVLVLSMGAKMPVRRPYTFVEQVSQQAAGGKVVTRPIARHGEEWTFTIKRGIRFGDAPCFPGGKGREATAADFVYSFKRMADPSVGCPIFNYVSPHVLGLQEFFDAESKRLASAKAAHQEYSARLQTPVQGLQVDPHDPYTFRIILRDRYPQLRYLMAMAFTSPIPHEAVEFYNAQGRNQLRQHPVGTGPYRLVEWATNERLVLVRNPYYHTDVYPSDGAPGDRARGLLQDAGKPLPLSSKIVFTVVREGMVGWTMFEQGYMDSWGVPKETFDKVVSKQGSLTPEMRSRGIRLDTDTGMDVSYFCFNMEDPVVGGYTPPKRKLRQALSLAFDTQEYLDLLSNGLGIPAQSVLPPGLFGYDPTYKNPYRQTNIEKAKRLLAEAGYPDGIDPSTQQPLVINYDNYATTPAGYQAVGLVIKQFERLGIKVVSRSWTYSTFQDRVNNGQFEFTYFGWVADYPDPENFYLLFYSPNKGPGPNAARYSNPTYDRLYAKMAAMDDGPARTAVIRQMRSIIQEDCPWIFVDHSQSLILHYDWLKNFKSHPVALNGAKYRRVDYRLRARERRQWNRPRYDILLLVLAVFILGSAPAIATVKHRRAVSARATRRTLISSGGHSGVPS